jgi:hypothetical protein
MNCKMLSILGLVAATLAAISGCAARDARVAFHDDLQRYQEILAETDYRDVHVLPQIVHPGTPQPIAMRGEAELTYWDLPLSEAIRIGLANTTVLADLGGTILQAPQTLAALQNPSIVETDPRFGVAAALSAFDAELLANATFQKNDRINNNLFTSGTNVLLQDRHDYDVALRKRSATGTEYILRQTWDYDSNNANGNIFPSAWNTAVEAEFRHPLMQGSGLDFNRIAGPNATLGNLNGVVIARINTDISLAELEIGLRNYLSNVENAYWDLYFAYRDLDAKKRARAESLNLWQQLKAKEGLPGAEADKVEQAREQYFRFEADVENALSGHLVRGTQADNDTTGGTFRANGGVYVAERRLRLLLGLPLNSEHLVRPAQDPSLAKVLFDWDSIVGECLTRRPELRRQRLHIQRQELQLIASRNFLKPRLDAVGQYRWRGFGDDLINSQGGSGPRPGNAYANLLSGDYQEWQLGVEFSMPLGFRQAQSAIRHHELGMARERAILERQERQVLHDLSNAVSELERAYKVAQVNLDRRNAAQQRLQALQASRETTIRNANLILDAQQRLASAESDFFRALAEYALAIKNVHVEKGTWKTYHEVFLADDVSCLTQGCAPQAQPVWRAEPAPADMTVPAESDLPVPPAPTPGPAPVPPAPQNPLPHHTDTVHRPPMIGSPVSYPLPFQHGPGAVPPESLPVWKTRISDEFGGLDLTPPAELFDSAAPGWEPQRP